ncbi:hypothetical protein [Nocardioides sp.]|uniref:hypothetical protein n=1 Tax=Nocardioides sp. TaxID=35761 RepID=UPI002601C712|nr:hypothetical protein [Nocardioides sp.]MDI6910480.1 hypothetical protein [Nocardioides sp.]
MKLHHRHPSLAAERLAVALETGVVTPDVAPLVAIANALRIPERGHEERHAETKARMLRAYDLAATGGDAGSRDGC